MSDHGSPEKGAHWGTIEQLVEMAASAPTAVARAPQQAPEPADSASASPEAAAVREVVKATEMIASIASDIAQLSKLQDVGRGQLQDLVNQVAYIRQAMDYTLFLAPDQANSESDLYPLFVWFKRQFENAVAAANREPLPASADSQTAAQESVNRDELAEIFRRELCDIEERLGELTRAIESRAAVESASAIDSGDIERLHQSFNTEIAALNHKVSSGSESTDAKLQSIGKTLTTLGAALVEQSSLVEALKKQQEEGGVSPYDDFDIRLEEMQQSLESQSSRMRATENIFFGLVAFMLLILMAMNTYSLAFR